MTARTVELLQPPVTQCASCVKVPYKSSAMLQMEIIGGPRKSYKALIVNSS